MRKRAERKLAGIEVFAPESIRSKTGTGKLVSNGIVIDMRASRNRKAVTIATKRGSAVCEHK
eukprot:1109675-Prorocentrum_minimum.AAC.2